MHSLRSADDGVNRTGWKAQGATDASGLVDDRNGQGPLDSVSRIQGYNGAVKKLRKLLDSACPTRGALVDFGITVRDCFRIRAAAFIATFGALRLRQYRIDPVGQRDCTSMRGGVLAPHCIHCFHRDARTYACARTNFAISGAMLARQRRPLKIP